jgi:hypothetical protein
MHFENTSFAELFTDMLMGERFADQGTGIRFFSPSAGSGPC